MIKKNDFILNLLKFAMPTIVTLIIGVVAIPILSRIYPIEEYAKINMFCTIANVIYIVAFLGLDLAYIRYYYVLPDAISHGQLLSLTMTVAIMINIFLFIVLYGLDIFSVAIYGEINHSGIVFLFIYTLGLILFRIANLWARMSSNAIKYGVQQLSQNLIGRILFVIVACFSTYYLYSIIFIALLTLIVSVYYVFQIHKQFVWKILPLQTITDVFIYALPLMPTTLLLWLNNSAAKLLLSRTGDFVSLGVFSMACTLTNAFAALPNAFGIYWTPFIYRNFDSEQALIKKVHDIVTLFCLLICTFLILFQDILYLYIGESYRVSQPYFMLLLLAPISAVLCETTGYGVNIAKKSYISLLIALTTCILNIGACYILLNKIGVLGAPISVGLSAIYQMATRSIIGQYYYVSIFHPLKSIIAWSSIIILCVLNLYIYNNLTFKIIVFILALCVSICLYKYYFSYILCQILKYIKFKEAI